ncbi:hypothetical protein PsAD26_04609 [Pseudovibrio sp. Ad26]|nr:hypothetical protein PsAD26_04609 [Pseudovibrio sp. Ad26]
MDETYIKVKGKWVYQYRAIDKQGETIDFMLSETRDEEAATRFFEEAISNNILPEKVVIDKSGANKVGLTNINICLFLVGRWHSCIDILQVKYLNNIVERQRPMMHEPLRSLARPDIASITVR